MTQPFSSLGDFAEFAFRFVNPVAEARGVFEAEFSRGFVHLVARECRGGLTEFASSHFLSSATGSRSWV